MKSLLEVDEKIFIFINKAVSNFWLDPVMLALSNKYLWGGLAFGFLFWLIAQKRWRDVKFFFFIIVTLAIADIFAHQVLKPFIGRPRPCKTMETVRVISGCGGFFAFPSNHATNSTVIAVLFALYSSIKVRYSIMLFIFVGLVGLSRVYLGVHYPLDVIGGFVLGAAVALIAFFVREKWRWNVIALKGTREVK